MTRPLEFRPAAPGDAGTLCAFLTAARLPAEDVDLRRQDFLLAFADGELAGCAAVEIRGGDALLRSVAVAPALRGRGVGDELVARILGHARSAGVHTAWLLTTTAEAWFAKRGFAPAERAAVPRRITDTSEFRTTCPASARCMVRHLA